MKKPQIIIIFAVALFFSGFAHSQEIRDDIYKFKITLPSLWTKTKTEETSKKDAISYSFEKKDGKNVLMLIAFKVDNVKNLNDFIYTLEKDMTLNIPSRKSDYTDFDMGSYDGRMAVYKDAEFTETIYYYRTKNSASVENYTYMLRFITAASYYNTTVEKEIKSITDTFAPTL